MEALPDGNAPGDGRWVTVAQVAQVIGPGGTDGGWMVWLHGRSDAFPDRYPTMEDAMRVVEANVADASVDPDDVTPSS
jgi:hypothetical protein